MVERQSAEKSKTNKTLSCCRGTARRAMLVNSYCVSRGIGARKGSNSKNWPSRSFKGIGNGAIRYSIYDFLSDFNCNHVFILHRYRDIITYCPKLKRSCNPEHMPSGSNPSFVHYYASVSISTRHLKCLISPTAKI